MREIRKKKQGKVKKSKRTVTERTWTDISTGARFDLSIGTIILRRTRSLFQRSTNKNHSQQKLNMLDTSDYAV
jgi:hypothetical protein